jgi:hypothetical protein
MGREPVLEITLLRLASSQSSPSNANILSILQHVRSLLAKKVNTTHSRFFRGVDDPTLVYILGVWPSIETHKEFLANEILKTEVL